MSQKLENYPADVQMCKRLIQSLPMPELNTLSIFDLFCYWYDHIYENEREEDEGEEEIGYVMHEKISIREIDLPDFLQSVNLDNL